MFRILKHPAHPELRKTASTFKFEESPFYPIIQAKAWNPKNGIRYAAISSFGFGGTNCHLILKEFSTPPQYVQKRPPLPPTQFQQKRYWVGKKIVDVSHQPFDRYGIPPKNTYPIKPRKINPITSNVTQKCHIQITSYNANDL